MTANSNTVPPAREKSTLFQIILAIFLVALAVAFYFIGIRMVQNRFHQGGHLDRNGHISR